MTDHHAPSGSAGKPGAGHSKALTAGARALRLQAKPLAFEANLAAQGLGDRYMKKTLVEYRRLLKYATALDELAGHTNEVNQARKVAGVE